MCVKVFHHDSGMGYLTSSALKQHSNSELMVSLMIGGIVGMLNLAV